MRLAVALGKAMLKLWGQINDGEWRNALASVLDGVHYQLALWLVIFGGADF
jgi:hypothetical protein